MSYYNIFDEYRLKHFQVPKVFFTSEKYKSMTNDDKMAWAILRDRQALSIKNGWYDENGDIYFLFSNDKLKNILGCGNDKLQKIKKKLIKLDLLDQKRVGQGKSNMLYLKKPSVTKNDIYEIDKEEGNQKNHSISRGSSEVRKSDFKKSENRTSRNPKIGLQEIRKSDTSHTKISDIDINNTNNNHHHLMKVGFTKKQAEMINRFQLENKLNDDDDVFHLLVNKLMKYKPNSMAYIAKVFETIKHEGHYTLNKNDEIVPDWFNDRNKSKEENKDLKNDDFDIDKLKEEMIDFVNEHKKDE